MAVNAPIVLFHSSVVKVGPFRHLQKAAFTGWTVIFLQCIVEGTIHISQITSFVFFIVFFIATEKRETSFN